LRVERRGAKATSCLRDRTVGARKTGGVRRGRRTGAKSSFPTYIPTRPVRWRRRGARLEMRTPSRCLRLSLAFASILLSSNGLLRDLHNMKGEGTKGLRGIFDLEGFRLAVVPWRLAPVAVSASIFDLWSSFHFIFFGVLHSMGWEVKRTTYADDVCGIGTRRTTVLPRLTRADYRPADGECSSSSFHSRVMLSANARRSSQIF
jgi:hypothetical protein